MPKQCCKCAATWLLPTFVKTRVVFAALALGVCLSLPSNVTVVDAFRAPACERCAGNRGIEYSVAPGSNVVAGLPGIVTFSGVVANTHYVVVQAATNPRVRVTYGGLASLHLLRGQEVARGDILGVSTTRLHLGVRLGERYVNPAQFAERSGSEVANGARPRHRVTLGMAHGRRCS
jgi:murein DD-endopeptidase MepM/ murein hydrolase activator NlpD